MRRGPLSRLTPEGEVSNLISRENTFAISSKLGVLEDVTSLPAPGWLSQLVLLNKLNIAIERLPRNQSMITVFWRESSVKAKGRREPIARIIVLGGFTVDRRSFFGRVRRIGKCIEAILATCRLSA